MIRQLWIRKVLATCVFAALFTTTSMVALANSGRIAAELTVSGKNINGETPVVKVNGESAKSGRSIFPSSTVTTPEDTSAVISVGKAGQIELGPNSSLNLTFDDKSVNGELTAGRLTVLSSLGTVSVRTLDGNTSTVRAGEEILASGKAQTKSGGSNNWWIWAVVAAGAAVVIIIAVSQSGNDTVVSPTR
ncbi:MAG: hypothetical protein WBD27_12765 [Pyrinomonadaceae bacterium]